MWEIRARLKRLIAVLVSLSLIGLHSVSATFAADMGAGCCSDLEARIAELEQTTARKDNRAVSLQLYGQVNKALLIWDDGYSSDSYVTDNSVSSSRFGMIGEGVIKPGWYAGYRIELEMKDAPSEEVFNGGDEGFSEGPLIRHSYVYIDSNTLGRISLGQQSPATDDITIINLGAKMSDAALHYNNNFGFRLDLGPGLTTDLGWGDFAHTVDSLRGDFIRYDSPAIYGFVVSAAWGEDDVWDVALRYSKDLNSFRFAGGIGYMDADEFGFEDFRGSFSAIHMPSGIFLSAAGGAREDETAIVGDGMDAGFYYGQIGMRSRILPYGETTFYGEYGVYKDYTVGQLLSADLNGGGPGDPFVTWGKIDSSEIRRFGFGVEQSFDMSGLLLYAQYHLYEADIYGSQCVTLGDDCLNDGFLGSQELPIADWSAVVLGARVQF